MTVNAIYQVFLVNTVLQPAVRDGEITSLSNAILNELLNGQETFKFDLKSSDPNCAGIVLGASQVQVVRNGTVVWWGILLVLEGNGQVNTYTAQDFSWLLSKRFVSPVRRIPYYSTRFQTASAGTYTKVASYVNLASKASAVPLALRSGQTFVA